MIIASMLNFIYSHVTVYREGWSHLDAIHVIFVRIKFLQNDISIHLTCSFVFGMVRKLISVGGGFG